MADEFHYEYQHKTGTDSPVKVPGPAPAAPSEPSKDYEPEPERKDRPSKAYGIDQGDQQSNAKSTLDYMRHFVQPEILAEGHNTGSSAVSKKISTLVHEGTPQKQAVATALSMKRAGRLTKEGGY